MIFLDDGKIIIKDISEGDDSLLEMCPIDFDEGGTSDLKLAYFLEETNNNYQRTIVALYEGKIAGYVNVCQPGTIYQSKRCQDDSTFFYDLYVLNKYRRCGIATELIKVAERLAKETSESIWCFITYSNTEAQPFYEKIGFKRADDNFYLFQRVCDFADFNDIVKKFDDEYIEYKLCKSLIP